ncbi:hypothetical protein WICPIJ_001207, partial [Wickerhamomyces pijperi]
QLSLNLRRAKHIINGNELRMKNDLYIGVDIGSTSVRVGLFDEEGKLKNKHETPISYQIDLQNERYITQSSEEIWSAFLESFDYLNSRVKSDEQIVSIGSCATCSLVVMIEEKSKLLVPYPVNLNKDQKDQNVIFWMDSRADRETDLINETLRNDGDVLEYMGGSMIPEMALPKLMNVMNNATASEKAKLRFFDLHDFFVFKLLTHDKERTLQLLSLNSGNDKIKVGIDGTIKGWSYEVLEKLNLQSLIENGSLPNLEKFNEGFNHVPTVLPGTKLGYFKSTICVSQGVIDSYCSWYSSSGDSPIGNLVMVSGTSTCFITSHNNHEGTIPGLWGPYQGVVKHSVVSAGGISLTGKLYERLFELHPATKEIKAQTEDIFSAVETQIQILEGNQSKSIHFLSKDMFYYGDLSGNRTPHCDPLMKGALFGETLDNSSLDLIKKYVCIMEYLVFQTKIIVDLANENHMGINQIVVSGSQGGNRRFLQLLADFINVPVFANKVDPGLAGVKGAFYLGFAAHKGILIDDVAKELNKSNALESYLPCQRHQSVKLKRLLYAKFQIMKDIANAQLKAFAPYDPETIEFGKPLTLIVGSNGVGKTTIIECLKFATTGELPPNAKGGAFVHDPLMMDDKSVKAEVKLAFKSVTGDSMICSRPLLLTLTKKSATFKSMDGQLLMKRGDTRTTISTKLSELKEQVPLALGVPPAILEHVIFCHQEDSLWPLSEPAVLKKRFDSIFQASQFTKALEQIKIQRKSMAVEIKLLQQSVDHLKQDKERADRTEEKMKQAQSTIENYEAEVGILKEELSDTLKKADTLFKTNQEFQEIISRLENMKNEERSLDFQISRVLEPSEWLPDSDEELQYKMGNFQALVREAEQGLEDLKIELSRDQQLLKRLRSDLNDTVGKEGLLKGKEDTYHENLTTRFDVAQQAEVELELEPQGGDFNKIETILMRLYNDHEVSLSHLTDKFQREQNALAIKVKSLSDSRLKENQHKEYTLSDISTSERQIKDIQAKINNLDVNEGDIEYQRTSLATLESKLLDFRQSKPVENLLTEIKQTNARIASIENDIDELNKEVSQIHKQSEVHARISIIAEQKERKESTLTKLLENRKELFDEFQIDLSNPSTSFRSLSEEIQLKLQTENKEYEKFNMNCNNIKNIINFKQEAMSKLETERQQSLNKIQAVLADDETVDDYPEIMEAAEQDHKNALENRKMRSTTLDFNRNALAFAEKESNCYLCKRKFEPGPVLSMFITELKIKTDARSEVELENQLKEAKAYLDEIKAIQSDIEKVKDINQKVANLEKDLGSSHKSLQLLQNKASEKKVIVDLLSSKRDSLDELRSPISEITRLQKEIKASEDELNLRKQDLANFGLSSRSLEDLQNEQSTKSEELKGLRRNITLIMEQKEAKQRELANLEGGIKDAKLNISNLERSLTERENLKHTVKDLKLKVEKLGKDVAKNEEIIEQIESELAIAEEEMKSTKQTHQSILDEKNQRLALEKSYYDKIKLLNEKIDYFVNNESKKLEAVRHSINNIRAEIEGLEIKVNGTSDTITEQTANLQDRSNQERILRGNIEVRQLQLQLTDIQRSISEIDVDRATTERDHYVEESSKLSIRQSEINAELAGKMGEMRQISDQVKSLQRELDTDFKDVKEEYRKAWINLQVITIHEQDLNIYSKALDNAIMNYHAMKMKEINKIIDELWKSTYKGTDVDTIRIESEPAKASESGMQRSYNYRVVMVKQDVKLDMRGRCSAGQKVLASIIIRLSLSECFGTNCGVIALDEPTTNLDADNIESLAKSLATIIELRKKQNNFQLIVITHDEKFLLAMQASKYTSHYYRISRDQSQKSRIESVDINKIVD